MKTVLSIQSHVAHGYVGGKAAIFPLQAQGWDVDNINTVNFSNHTGYGSVRGLAADPEELKLILDQLVLQRESLPSKGHYGAVITGYIPNATLIGIVHDYIGEMKANSQQHPSGLHHGLSTPLYLLDPVMGDNNYLYVEQNCIEQNKRVLSRKLVDIITPNQFELELLVGYKIDTQELLATAIQTLHHEYSVPYVVITSLDGTMLGNSSVIGCAVSTSVPGRKLVIRTFEVPVIKSYFTGVGDLFSALLLDKLVTLLSNNAEDALVLAVNQVLTIMRKTLLLTHRQGLEAAAKATGNNGPVQGKINDGDTMKYFELRVVQSRDFFAYDGPGEYLPKEMVH
ncbi:Ribokinase-like protein [Suhomyces tanzawaensis NRRL Y-17324]|uniref:pyridoxal kinase n=1 Tax=Suhomyces tanzawaensis NRRL Y-17324 TaxID=984487 RepID=A0A1E4SPD2_9ASCO|nr:Ribokinase-like protein [Suhomyces tanzawaensis NRRL Y-17324]ODV81390.1 Ribokinase-like protein [Suhomyces tanzawaensis NRRL Y-17324]